MTRQYIFWTEFLARFGVDRTLAELAKDSLDEIATRHIRELPENERLKALEGYIAGRFS